MIHCNKKPSNKDPIDTEALYSTLKPYNKGALLCWSVHSRPLGLERACAPTHHLYSVAVFLRAVAQSAHEFANSSANMEQNGEQPIHTRPYSQITLQISLTWILISPHLHPYPHQLWLLECTILHPRST